MGKKVEILLFVIIFALFGFYLFQPERRTLAGLYKQKMFLYMNRKNTKIIFGRDFEFKDKVLTYGENVVMQPGDLGTIPYSLSYGTNVLLFSVKRSIGIGENPVMVVVVNNDTLGKEVIWSEEWIYVKVKAEISKQKMKSSFVQIACEKNNLSKTTQKLILSKMYIVNKR